MADPVSTEPERQASQSPPVVVKKYANRRLYNTESSSYITLDNLADMVRQGRDFVVYDAKTGDDITRGVLTQIIVEEEGKGRALLPTAFLRQLIGFYGDSMQGLVPRYLEQAMTAFAQQQEQMRATMQQTMGNLFPFANIEEMSRQNIAMMERAMSLFTPFYTHRSPAARFARRRRGARDRGAAGRKRTAQAGTGDQAAGDAQVREDSTFAAVALPLRRPVAGWVAGARRTATGAAPALPAASHRLAGRMEAGAGHEARGHAERAFATNARISAGSLMPRARSTPEDTSTQRAPVTRIASATLSGVRPPASTQARARSSRAAATSRSWPRCRRGASHPAAASPRSPARPPRPRRAGRSDAVAMPTARQTGRPNRARSAARSPDLAVELQRVQPHRGERRRDRVRHRIDEQADPPRTAAAAVPARPTAPPPGRG